MSVNISVYYYPDHCFSHYIYLSQVIQTGNSLLSLNSCGEFPSPFITGCANAGSTNSFPGNLLHFVRDVYQHEGGHGSSLGFVL